MRITGEIYPKDDSTSLTHEAWCQFVASRPEFRRHESTEARNPFSGETMIVHPPPGSAEVVLDGKAVGEVYWSMNEEPAVIVCVEQIAMPLVNEWAESFGAEYRMYPPLES